MGFNFDEVFKKSLLSDQNIKKIESLGVLPFKNFVKSNMADIADADWVES